MDPKTLLEWIVQLGSFGVLALIVWWIFREGVPKFLRALSEIAERHQAQLDRQRDEHARQLHEMREDAVRQREDAAAEQRLARADFTAALREQQHAFGAELRAQRETCHATIEKLAARS